MTFINNKYQFWCNINSFSITYNKRLIKIFEYNISKYFDISLTILQMNGFRYPSIKILGEKSEFDNLYKFYWYLLQFFSFGLMNPTYAEHVYCRSGNIFIEVWFRRAVSFFSKTKVHEEKALFMYDDIKFKLITILLK